MARIADTMTWASYEAAFRAALGVATGEDAYLEALLEAAADAADTFIDRDWTDANGDDVDIPKKVIQGVYEWATVVYAARPSTTSTQPPGAILTKVKTNVIEETYAAAPGAVATTEAQALAVARLFWWGSKKNKGR